MGVNERDWETLRKGDRDVTRHKEKVRNALEKNLPVFTESFYKVGDNKSIVTLPQIPRHRIKFGGKKEGVGSGDGKDGDSSKGAGDEGKGSEAGQEAGTLVFEKGELLKELDRMLLDNLELPRLLKKNHGVIRNPVYEWNNISRVGGLSRVDKKRTLLETFKRNALDQNPSFTGVRKEDLRFRTYEESIKKDSRAVIFAMMDISGSMGKWEKFVGKQFYFWVKRFLDLKYEDVEIVYVGHHTQAKVLSEHQFFNVGESGGTICSSAYRLALESIKNDYGPKGYNAYVFHVSDGDNLSSDNNMCARLINKLVGCSQLIGYVETNAYNKATTLANAYEGFKDKAVLENDLVRTYRVSSDKDVLLALKSLFRKEEGEV